MIVNDTAGWNRSSSNLVYTVVVNTLGGGSCINPEIAGVRYYEIGAKLYSTELNNVSDLGLYYTVDKKMRYDTISGEEVLMYSRYEGRGNGSSVYMVKTGVRRVLTDSPDCYDYSSGITGNDTETHPGFTEEPTPEALAEMKLTPYKGLSSETIIRYLYTGREYNIETGDYYYRYRMMETGIGRFTSKDPILHQNLYGYVENKPLLYTDPTGNFPWVLLGLIIKGTIEGLSIGGAIFGTLNLFSRGNYINALKRYAYECKIQYQNNPTEWTAREYFNARSELMKETGMTAVEFEKNIIDWGTL